MPRSRPGASPVVGRMFLALVMAASAAALLQAQIPGRNVNMVSGRTLPDGDPYLQRQNEPSIAASTRNPLHLLAGANDYRTVDLPGLPNSNETGDAWMGAFKSYDGGNTWRSTLIPGYPQDPNRASSPLNGYKAAADPVVRAGTNGLFYYSGIVFDRSTPSKSAMFVSRFIDNNNQEAGDPVVFVDTKLVATNDGTAFIDKPWFAVDVPRAGAQTCTFSTTQKSPTTANPARVITVNQSFAGGAAYAAFSLITGEGTDTRSQIYLSRSLDCGQTWSPAVQISSSLDPINQGATLAIDPRNGTVYLAWRRFTADGTDDSIMVTRSMDQGRKWDPPGRARRFPRGRKVGLGTEVHGKKFKPPTELTELASLDQPTQTYQFRTNAYPTMSIDGAGRVYVAWSERGFAPNSDPDEGDARIVIATSTDGSAWSAPTPVDNTAVAGHQVMPTMTFAGGKLMLAYYDFREDVSGVFRRFVDETSAIYYGNKRHTVDVRASMASPAAVPAFAPSVRVSEYLMGSRPGVGLRPVEQLQYNPPNLKLFKLGTVPFVGDYIDLTPSPAFVPTAGGGWTSNTAPASSPLFHVVWTDNRDVVPPANGDWTTYTPPASAGGPSTYDPTQTVAPCMPGREGMRNQNVYTARLTGGLVAGSPGNTKPLSPLMPRAFVVFAQNATDLARTFRLTIENQPVGGRASFLQTPLPPYTDASPAPVTTVDVTVPRRSTIARSVFATSTDPDAQIRVSVREISAAGGAEVAAGLQATVVLNPDISNPDISNPDISNPDISNPDISNAEVSNPDISNPDISNPDISNPDISNPDISNPDISNPDISNVQVANPDISNPDISNPDISNPDISNPDISNPDISNPDISNQSLTDTTWTVTNEGNTASAYSIKLLLNGAQPTSDQIALQLILRKVYTTPVAVNCTLGLHAHNVLLANITNPVFADVSNPDISNPDISNPDISNATLWLAPGETAKITLRVMDKKTNDLVTFDAAAQVTPAVMAQALDVEVVDGVVAVADAVSVALPPASPLNVQFVDVPESGTANQPLGTVAVRVFDSNESVLPGVTVALSRHVVPGDAPYGAVLTALTNVDGTATFNIGALPAGTYRLRAQVTALGYAPTIAWSSIFTVSPNPVVQWTVASGGNGNYYEYVRVGGLTWTQARAAAEARSYNGIPGRLVTIGSAAENQFVNGLRDGGDLRAWIGLFDPNGSGDFQWTTGEPLNFTNWGSGEPNNFGTERWVEMFGDATWNNNVELDQFPTLGYVAEYAVAPPGATGSLTYTAFSNVIGTWTQNVPQTFSLTVDMTAQTTSLSIDGTPVANAQNVPFTATTLERVGVEFGTTGTQRFAWDDITITGGPSQSVIFSGNFNGDAVDQPPAAPSVGTWQMSTVNGSVLVRTSSGNLFNVPVEIEQFGGTNSVSLVAVPSSAPASGTWTIQWTSVMAAPGSQAAFIPVVVRGNGGIIASVEYR